MFRAQRKTNGNSAVNAIIITTNASFKFDLKKKKEMTNAAIPIATFNP